jgi:bifunctional N-acetylglucosamine-1-phosphate-uridyltransferase/glucosamine-1-phosphate-acetyltransferase GlmU-like protein
VTRPLLVVPAAGLGTRLQSPLPKLLVPVAGVAMIDRILALYGSHVAGTIVVVNPAALDAVRLHLREATNVDILVQERATGMLDAIMLAQSAVERTHTGAVWVTWCDQVAVQTNTVDRLARMMEEDPGTAVVMPTVRRADPYIHFERDRKGRIVRVLQRREGDAMPAEGESDMGLFALSSEAFRSWLPDYAASLEAGRTTGERNFLPFIPWVGTRAPVLTFPASHPMEAIGVNTVEELRHVEEYLKSRRL